MKNKYLHKHNIIIDGKIYHILGGKNKWKLAVELILKSIKPSCQLLVDNDIRFIEIEERE